MQRIISSLFAGLIAVVLVSCQTAPKRRQPVKATPSIEQDFKQARLAMEAGDNKKALARFKKIATSSPDSDLADDANMMMAQIYERQQLWNDALQSYMAVAQGELATPFESLSMRGPSRWSFVALNPAARASRFSASDLSCLT